MAAAEDGHLAEIETFPEGEDGQRLDDRPVAQIRLVQTSVAPDPLFSQVLARRTLKEPFDTSRTVSDKVLARLRQSIPAGVATGSTNETSEVAALRQLTRAALDLEIRTPHTFEESVELFRIGKAEIEANPDGIDFSGVFFETLAAFGQFNREVASDPNSSAFQQGHAALMAQCDTAMGYLWLTTAANRRHDQIAAVVSQR